MLRGDAKAPLAIGARPIGAAELLVSVTPSRPVAAPPVVEVSVTGERQAKTFSTKADPGSGSYVVTIPVEVGELLMLVGRGKASGDGAPLVAMARINTTLIDPKETVMAFSANGQLSLMVPPGALPPGSWLAFGPADVAPPPDRIFVREPQRIAANSGSDKLAKPVDLHIVLPDPQEGGAHPKFDPATARIERFDPERNQWEPQPSQPEDVPLAGGFFLETDRLGIYAVTARR
jgi:hypothetical protein